MPLLFNIFLFMNFLLFSSLSHSLESSDRLKTQILKIYDKNVLVINRGLEDAIFRKDHIKLTSSDGFIARGICIKATLITSHWKIYRVTRPELISKDTLYLLTSINQSRIPSDLIMYSKVDFSKYYKKYFDPSRAIDLQAQRIAKYDLPKDTQETTAFKKVKESDFKKFVERNFTKGHLKNDLKKVYLNIFASPISWQTRYNQKETHYGVKLYNIGTKYQFELNSIESQRRILDPITKEGYSSKSSHHDALFQLNHLTDFLSIISFVRFDKEKIGDTYYPNEYYQIGVIGIKLHLWEEDQKNNFFDLSYTPTFDSIEFSNPNLSEEKTFLKRQGIRHYFKARIYSDFTSILHNKTELIYAPLVPLSSSTLEKEDTKINIKTIFSYNMGKNFYWDYILDYQNDNLRADIYDISAQNTTQTFRLRYEIDI